jgi:hypothetical protein
LKIRRQGPNHTRVQDVCKSTVLMRDKWTEGGQFEDYKVIHDRFLEKLDEKRSPMSTIIWFGKFKGHEMRQHYNASQRWAWLKGNEIVWQPDLEEIEARYEKWLGSRVPRAAPSSRTAPNIVNPKGKALGTWDDEPPASTETYERDSFVASNNSTFSDEGERSGTRKTDSSIGVKNMADHQDRRYPGSSSALPTDSSESNLAVLPRLADNIEPRLSPKGPHNRHSAQPADSNAKDELAAITKRKYDAMLNLSQPLSQSGRNRAEVITPKKRKRTSRKSTKQSPPSQRKATHRQPLANMNIINSNTPSRSQDEKYLAQGSSGTIVVQMPNTRNSVSTKHSPKYGKKLAEAPAGVKAFFRM